MTRKVTTTISAKGLDRYHPGKARRHDRVFLGHASRSKATSAFSPRPPVSLKNTRRRQPAPVVTVADIFGTMESRVNPDGVKGITANYGYVITGSGGGNGPFPSKTAP